MEYNITINIGIAIYINIKITHYYYYYTIFIPKLLHNYYEIFNKHETQFCLYCYNFFHYMHHLCINNYIFYYKVTDIINCRL